MAQYVREVRVPSPFARSLFNVMAAQHLVGITILRCGLVLVLVWIGGLKFVDYEADSIVPLIANSPAMSFVYTHPAPEYRQYMNKEGETIVSHHEWHKANHTYPVSHVLGFVIVSLGLMIALHRPSPQIAAIGSALLIGMSCVTLSFLVTTPEAWVQTVPGRMHGFPYLSGVGRLIVKDFIMLGAAFVTMSHSASAYLRRRGWSPVSPKS